MSNWVWFKIGLIFLLMYLVFKQYKISKKEAEIN